MIIKPLHCSDNIYKFRLWRRPCHFARLTCTHHLAISQHNTQKKHVILLFKARHFIARSMPYNASVGTKDTAPRPPPDRRQERPRHPTIMHYVHFSPRQRTLGLRPQAHPHRRKGKGIRKGKGTRKRKIIRPCPRTLPFFATSTHHKACLRIKQHGLKDSHTTKRTTPIYRPEQAIFQSAPQQPPLRKGKGQANRLVGKA